MGDKVSQEVKGNEGANIIQSAGDTNIVQYGVSTEEVVNVCTQVVRTILDIHSVEAEKRFQERLDNFCNSLVPKLQEHVRNDVLESFNEPAIQYALRESIKACVEVNDEELTDDLVDLMIERMSVAPRTTDQYLIDEARRTLPKMNKVHLNYLALRVLLMLQIGGGRETLTDFFAKKLSPILQCVSNASLLDIDYLGQIGCLGNHHLFLTPDSMEKELLMIYDYYFRHPCSVDDFNDVLHDHPLNEQQAVNVWNLMESETSTLKPKHTSGKSLESLDEQYKAEKSFVNDLVSKKCRKMTVEEVQSELVRLNPAWRAALDIMNVSKLPSLSTLGQYLGLRYLSKITGHKLPMSLFYSDVH